jgi:hypothetical protein
MGARLVAQLADVDLQHVDTHCLQERQAVPDEHVVELRGAGTSQGLILLVRGG